MYIHTYKHIYICLLTCLWHYQRKHGVRKELRSSLWFALLLEDLKMVEKESSVTKSLRILLPSKRTRFPSPPFPGGTVLSLPWSPTPPLRLEALILLSLHFPTFSVASSSFEFVSTSLQKSCCLFASTATNWIGPIWVLPMFPYPTPSYPTTSQMVIKPLSLRCLGQLSITHGVKLQYPIGSSSRLDIKCSRPSPASSHADPHLASCPRTECWVKSNRLNGKLILLLTIFVHVLSLRILIW